MIMLESTSTHHHPTSSGSFHFIKFLKLALDGHFLETGVGTFKPSGKGKKKGRKKICLPVNCVHILGRRIFYFNLLINFISINYFNLVIFFLSTRRVEHSCAVNLLLDLDEKKLTLFRVNNVALNHGFSLF